MKVLYDGDIYTLQAAGGINRYFEGVISNLPAEYAPLLITNHIWPTNWPHHPRLKVYKAPTLYPPRLSRRLARYYFRAVSKAVRPDIVHPTYFYSLTAWPCSAYRCPVVVTVYDFILALFSDHSPTQNDQIAAQRRAITSADAVICISHNTRNELLERFPGLESRTTVTHLAGDIDLASSYGDEIVPERPYFLFVGSRIGYKNFDGLLRAFAQVATPKRDVALAVAGSPFNDEEKKRIETLKISDLVEPMGYVAENHLAKLYRCSMALVYPSFYEGFGIPPLEAMGCQTLVIAARSSSLPEVCGDAALWFDPNQPDQLTQIMHSVLRGELDRQNLLQKGAARAQMFNWQQTSQQTAQVYRSLL